MKLVPCRECSGQPILIRRKPSDLFLTIGTMHDRELRGACLRCKKPFRLTAPEFARLPEMTWAELKAPTCDLDADSLIDEAHDEALSETFLTINRSTTPGLRADVMGSGQSPIVTEEMMLKALKPRRRR